MRGRRGASLVEFVFVIGIWGSVVSAFLLCCRLKMAQQEALSVASWAAQLESSGLVEPHFVSAAFADYFSKEKMKGVSWSWRHGRFTGTTASRFYRLMAAEVEARFYFSPLVVREHVVIQEASEL